MTAPAMSHKHLFADEDLFDVFNAEVDDIRDASSSGTGIGDAIRMEEIEGTGDTRTAMYRRDHEDESDSDNDEPPPLVSDSEDDDSSGPPPLIRGFSDETSEDSQSDEEDVPLGVGFIQWMGDAHWSHLWRLIPDSDLERQPDGHATVAEDEEKDDEKYGYKPQEEEPDENPPVEPAEDENPPSLVSSDENPPVEPAEDENTPSLASSSSWPSLSSSMETVD